MIKRNKTIKNFIWILFGMLLLGLTGCGNSIPNMTKEQEQQIGEYAAVMMLKYDANHRSRLVNLENYPEEIAEDDIADTQPEPAPEQSQVEIPTENPEVSPVTVVDNSEENGGVSSAEELLGLPEGVYLIYRGYSVTDSYPEDGTEDFFALDASPGKKFLVLHFTIDNQSGMSQYLDMVNDSVAFKCTVNETYRRSSLVTMLADDFATFLGTIGTGCTQDVVLLYEMDADVLASPTSISLEIKNASNAYTIQL